MTISIATDAPKAMSIRMTKNTPLPDHHISAVIEMALSDHVSFADIRVEYGLQEKQVKALMRDQLKPSSYKTWRKRVRDFGTRRAHYK
jgi:uncharacterized protein (TIGR03643 family)